jgi:hypothetical protein
MLFVFDDIRDRLTNRHLLFFNRSLALDIFSVDFEELSLYHVS